MAEHIRLPTVFVQFGDPVFQSEAEARAFIHPEDPEGIIGRVTAVNKRIKDEASRLFGVKAEDLTPNQVSLAATKLGLSGPGSLFSGVLPQKELSGVRLPDGQGLVLDPSLIAQVTAPQPAALSQSLGVEPLIDVERVNILLQTDTSLFTEDDWNVMGRVYGDEVVNLMRSTI